MEIRHKVPGYCRGNGIFPTVTFLRNKKRPPAYAINNKKNQYRGAARRNSFCEKIAQVFGVQFRLLCDRVPEITPRTGRPLLKFNIGVSTKNGRNDIRACVNTRIRRRNGTRAATGHFFVRKLAT